MSTEEEHPFVNLPDVVVAIGAIDDRLVDIRDTLDNTNDRLSDISVELARAADALQEQTTSPIGDPRFEGTKGYLRDLIVEVGQIAKELASIAREVNRT